MMTLNIIPTCCALIAVPIHRPNAENVAAPSSVTIAASGRWLIERPGIEPITSLASGNTTTTTSGCINVRTSVHGSARTATRRARRISAANALPRDGAADGDRAPVLTAAGIVEALLVT